LVRRELSLTPKPNAARLRSFSTLACASQDQVTLKLGKAAKHSEHQSTMRSGCVGPLIA
jgi:hypothetical protein